MTQIDGYHIENHGKPSGIFEDPAEPECIKILYYIIRSNYIVYYAKARSTSATDPQTAFDKSMQKQQFWPQGTRCSHDPHRSPISSVDHPANEFPTTNVMSILCSSLPNLRHMKHDEIQPNCASGSLRLLEIT